MKNLKTFIDKMDTESIFKCTIIEAYESIFNTLTESENEIYEVSHIDGKKPVKTKIKPVDRDFNNIPRFANGKLKVRFQDWLELSSSDGNGLGLGKSSNGKWYGWSHRAVYGFGIGDKVKKGDCTYNGREYTIKTEKQAKETARRFADSVA